VKATKKQAAAKVAKVAKRKHPDPRHVSDLLDGLPGALERAQQGLEDAKAGRTVTLGDL
jgi:hypothetical protein